MKRLGLKGPDVGPDRFVTAEKKVKDENVTFEKVELLTGEVASIGDDLIDFMELFFRDFDSNENKHERSIYNEFMVNKY